MSVRISSRDWRSRPVRRVAKISVHFFTPIGGRGIEACVLGGGRPWGSGYRTRRNDTVCARGRNPRLAMAMVLAKYANKVKRRKGAFAGMRR